MTDMPQSRRLDAALRRESTDLLRYFRRRVAPEDAADLLAETAMTAWRRVADLPTDDEGTRRWLFSVAHNIYLNHQRGERRRLALANKVRAVLSRVALVAPPADHGIEVRDAISRLPPDMAEIVRLIHWDGLTVTEAAAVLGLSASTTRARYQRARAALHETLSATSTFTRTW